MDRASVVYHRYRAYWHAADARLNAALRALRPALPADSTQHLAHNWYVCRGDAEVIGLVDRYRRFFGRLYARYQREYWRAHHECRHSGEVRPACCVYCRQEAA